MKCVVCDQGTVKPFLDFGELPLGNVFLKKEEFASEKKYGLELGMCSRCKLVQQTQPPPVEALQADYRNYHYVPFGETLARHYQEMAAEAVTKAQLNADSLVYDVGSNNGLFLGTVGRMTGCKIVGVEPAKEIARSAIEAGIPTVDDFFTKQLAYDLAINPGRGDLVVCTQTLQHIPEVNDFVKSLALIMKPDGLLMIEGRYWGATIEKGSYDTVYHEMQWFFTLRSLIELLRSNGMEVVAAQRNEIYGGSLRVYAKKAWGFHLSPLGRDELLAQEQQAGLNSLVTYKRFAKSVKEHKTKLHRLVETLKQSGKRIVAYGAPSTSATLMNYCQIDSSMVDYVVDDSKLKQGFYTPGTHIRIVSADTLSADPPDYLLLNAWRLKAEILDKVKRERRNGMKVIVPLPEIQVLE